MQTCWLERDRSTRRNFKAALYGSHLHDAAFEAHGVDLAFRSSIARNTHQTLWRCASVGNGHISRRRACAFRSRARPGLSNVDRANIVVRSLTGRRHKLGHREHAGADKAAEEILPREMRHGPAPVSRPFAP